MPKLFEQAIDNNPNSANRLSFGRAGFAALNMTLSSFLGWLNANLTFPAPADATTVTKGIAALATQSEVNTGSDANKIVTSSTLKATTFTGTITSSPALAAPWSYSAVGGHSVRKIASNIVHISMVVFKTDVSIPTLLLTLAAEFRPLSTQIIHIVASSSFTTKALEYQSISIAASGAVNLVGSTPAANDYLVQIDGIYYLD